MARPRLHDYDKIWELYKSGLSYRKVASAMGINKLTVYRALKHYGGGRPVSIANKLKFPGCDERQQYVIELYRSGVGSTTIGRMTGINEGYVRQIVRQAGLSRSPKDAAQSATLKPKLIVPRPAANGYLRILTPGGKRVQVHRLVMEQKLGRKLLAEEVVHHKNGIRSDNRPENLELVESKSAHRSMHKSGALCIECSQPARCRNLCDKHYQRVLKRGGLGTYPKMRGSYPQHAT